MDDSLREIALLTMNSVEVDVQNSDTFTFDFSLKSFQIDDLNPLALMNVAVGGYPQSETDSVIRLHANMYQNTPLFTAFKELVLRIEPIVILADLSFISDLMFLLSKSNVSGVKTKEGTESVPFTADILEIGELAAAVFVRPRTRRPWVYHPRPNRLRFVPDVTNGQITIPASAFAECMMTRSYVKEEIVKPLIKSVQSQSMKLFFKTNVFCPLTGTGKSKFANQAKRLRHGEIKALGRIGGTVMFHGGETIFNGIAQAVHAVTGSRSEVERANRTAAQTAASAAVAVGKGFFKGFTGLVMDPIRGGREKGVLGVFQGMATGVVGVVSKPVAGIMDGTAGALGALTKLANGEDNEVMLPARCARAFPGGKVGFADSGEGGKCEGTVRVVDVAQKVIQRSADGRWARGFGRFLKPQTTRAGFL
jgi:hypothetical protein